MKKFIWYLLMLMVAAALIGYYYTQRDFRNDIRYIKADINISAQDLHAAFSVDEDSANGRFLGKIIAVAGLVQSVDTLPEKTTISLDTGDPMSAVVCEMNANIQSDFTGIVRGEELTVKGECSGKLFDIILVNCVINE
jgi:hypothetical protein